MELFICADVKRISLRLLPYSGDDKDSEGDGLGLPDEICHTLMRTKGMEIFEITDISVRSIFLDSWN